MRGRARARWAVSTISAAGHVRGIQAGNALAAVATMGYLELLAGPPLIGLTAHVTSLPVALGLVSAFCAAIGVGGRALVPAVIPTRSTPSSCPSSPAARGSRPS